MDDFVVLYGHFKDIKNRFYDVNHMAMKTHFLRFIQIDTHSFSITFSRINLFNFFKKKENETNVLSLS